MENVRELALDMLMEVLEKGKYSHLVIRSVLEKYNYIDVRDKAFIKRVVEGTLEQLIRIDYVLDQFSKVPVRKMKPLIRTLMRLSVYQLLFMDQVPDGAVCNEAVKLAGKRGFKGLSGFVNGVLRNIARNRENIRYPDRSADRAKALSVRYSMPEWLIGFWDQAYGEERTEEIVKGLLAEHPVTVRMRAGLSKEKLEEWIQDLSERKIQVQSHGYHAQAFTLRGTEGIQNLPGYGDGLFMVQDVSSMLAVEAAGPYLFQEDKELCVVDVCAAPGGKSLHMAEKISGRGTVLSRDLTENKVSLIRDNIDRMGISNVTVRVWDALVFDENLLEKADVVLADLPCSGLGVMGKKRDIKYRITRKAMEELADLQRRILDVVWKYVKPGGILIYSTCTINPEENEQMADWFVQNHPFEFQSLSPYLPDPLKEQGAGGTLQFFPGIQESDGFFIARLVRKGK